MNDEAQRAIEERNAKRIEAVNLLRVALPEVDNKAVATAIVKFLAEYDELHAKVKTAVFG